MSTPLPTSASPARVLVVDDHPFFREGIITWIGRQSHLVICGAADSVDEAYQVIVNLQPDLVLLDLCLRDGDGLELLRRLKQEAKPARVIVVSNKSESMFVERSLRAGAKGYVLKDEAAETMLAAIDAVLKGGTYISAAMRPASANGMKVNTDGTTDRLGALYNRELEVLELLGRGFTTKEIAGRLGLSAKTIETYRENLKKKLGFTDSVTLIHYATVWQNTRQE